MAMFRFCVGMVLGLVLVASPALSLTEVPRVRLLLERSGKFSFLTAGAPSPMCEIGEESYSLDLNDLDPSGPTAAIVLGPNEPLPDLFPVMGDVWQTYFHALVLKLLRP